MLVKFEEEKIDWRKQQILICKNVSDLLILTTGTHALDTFEGISISRNPEFSTHWLKGEFKVFTGSISND